MKIHVRRWIEVGPHACNAALWRGHGYPLLRSKSKAGKCSASARIRRSRVTCAAPAAVEALAYDPQTSGGLLAAVDPRAAGGLEEAGFAVVGRVVAGPPSVRLR